MVRVRRGSPAGFDPIEHLNNPEQDGWELVALTPAVEHTAITMFVLRREIA